jgi:hypothetical protein
MSIRDLRLGFARIAREHGQLAARKYGLAKANGSAPARYHRSNLYNIEFRFRIFV